MKSKKDKLTSTKQTEYHLLALVKETNQENGPGHVSVSTVKKNADVVSVNHTSFYPGPLGSLLNGLTLGSLPVKGQLAASLHDDLEEAQHVLVKKVGKEEYKNAKKAQRKFHQEVNNSSRFYSVFGTSNPFASGFAFLLSSYRNAELSARNHKKKIGFAPSEDLCGIHVFDDEHHVTTTNITADNCASSVTHVLNSSGHSFANPGVPTFFTNTLQNQGFKEVTKEELTSSFGFDKN